MYKEFKMKNENENESYFQSIRITKFTIVCCFHTYKLKLFSVMAMRVMLWMTS